MGLLDNLLGSAVPGGRYAKPLGIALLALSPPVLPAAVVLAPRMAAAAPMRAEAAHSALAGWGIF